MKNVAVFAGLSLCVLAGCKKVEQAAPTPGTGTAPEVPAVVDAATVAVTPPTVQPSAIPLPAGVFPTTDAIAVLVASPAMLIEQRAGANVAVRIVSHTCTPGVQEGRGRYAGPTFNCTWRSDRCEGTLVSAVERAIGSTSTSLTVTARPLNGAQDEALCAGIAGTFSQTHGGPVAAPLPSIANAACLAKEMKFSDDGAACMVQESATTIATFTGACCVGTRVATFTAAANARDRWVSEDAATLVVAPHGVSLAVADQQSNAVIFNVMHGTNVRELHVNDVFAGDPVLRAGTGFSMNVRVGEGALVAESIGGASHRIPLGG